MPSRAFARVLVVTLGLAALAAPTAANAADPRPGPTAPAPATPKKGPPGAPMRPYEGRKLPDFVRELIWQKACDLPQADANGCGLQPCPLVRTDGTRFRPFAAPWFDLLSLEWQAGAVVLSPALVEGKLATEADTGGSARTALGMASGLGLATNEESALFKINPTFVAWIERELLPPPSQPMCGATAQVVYDLAFQRAIRLYVDTYAQLKQRGLLAKVSVAELSQSFDKSKGRYFTACKAVAGKLGTEDDAFIYQSACFWWLRRAASGAIEPIAELLARVVSQYDPSTYQRLRGQLPKVTGPRVIIVP